MNRTFLIGAVVITLVVCSCSSAQNESKKVFDKLQWMEGKWVSSDVANYTEIWKRVSDTCYEGLSVSPVDSANLVEERPKIVRRNDSIHFISEIEESTVEGQTQDFVMTSKSPDTLIFANNGVNYPNRITYKRINDTLMKVVVERKNTEGPIKFEYTLKKVK